MKQGIHPEYVESRFICSCGSVFVTRSTVPEVHLELCSMCHPFYTGKQKFVDTGGRVQRFEDKFGGAAAAVADREAAARDERRKAAEAAAAEAKQARDAKAAEKAARASKYEGTPLEKPKVEAAEADVDAAEEAVAEIVEEVAAEVAEEAAAAEEVAAPDVADEPVADEAPAAEDASADESAE
ncbi:MAG: 50S ribosomal protein L31 [Actinobacteria bacterium]|nr:MAG: 50S ribosomal protein L31 [Actinomycetota bacterium]